MKNLFLVYFLFFNVVLFAQPKQQLYTLKNVYPVCMSSNTQTFYGIDWSETKARLKEYDIKTGNVVKELSVAIPENPIKLMVAHPEKNFLYMISTRKVDDTKNRYIDAIYRVNTKRDRLELLRKVYYNHKIPNKVGFVNNQLVFITFQEPTYVFDLNKKDFSLLNPNTDYQILSIAPKKAGYLMLNIKEVDGRKIPIYFMDQNKSFSHVIGYLEPDLTIKSEVRSFHLKNIYLKDSSYNWIYNTIRYNCFPLYGFEIAMRPYWIKQSYLLDKAFALSGILFSNEEFLIAKIGNEVAVYYLYTNDDSELKEFSESDIQKIEDFLNDRNTYDKDLIDSEVLDLVFDGVFYNVYSKNRLKSIAVYQHGSYFKLSDYSQLVSLVKSDFVLSNKEQAKLFQDALNVVFPVDAYGKKHVQNYQAKNAWVFVRGEAFGNKVGMVVNLNEDGKIQDIEYKSAL